MFRSSFVVRCFFFFAVSALLSYEVQGQSNKVSPKLDFDSEEDKNNSSLPVIPGTGQNRNDDRRTGNSDRDMERDKEERTDSGSGKGGNKSGPKIHGVRVTVDTGDTKTSKESKESVEITDLGKHKKRVGIHTDITFEITANGDNNGNETSSEQKMVDKEDASVPIFKGRKSPTSKPRKSYDPKTHWNPNFSTERRGYDSSGRFSPSYGSEYYPPYPYNKPAYSGSTDYARSGTPVYRFSDGWSSYVPVSSTWTTERSNYNELYRPNSVNGYRAPSWKPCYCLSSSAAVDSRARRDDNRDKHFLRPTSSVINVVNGKLESPFSRK